MERDNSMINKKKTNIDHNNKSIYKTKNESDQIKAAKIGAKATILAAIIGVGGIILGFICESNRGQNDINETFSEIAKNEDGNITLDEIKQAYLSLKRNYEVASDEIQKLNSEKEKLIKILNDANNTTEELQAKLSIKDQEIKALNDKISGMYNVDFQNLNLIINGMDSGFNDRVATINNETFYSIGFMKYLVDNQAVSSDGVRLFCGSVQAEEKIPISLFDANEYLECGFLRHYYDSDKKSPAFIDNNGTEYFNGVFRVIPNFDTYNTYIECLVDDYSTFTGTIILNEAYKATNHSARIIIYGDDNVIYSSPDITRGIDPVNFSIDISNIKLIRIEFTKDYELLALVNPYLYP